MGYPKVTLACAPVIFTHPTKQKTQPSRLQIERNQNYFAQTRKGSPGNGLRKVKKLAITSGILANRPKKPQGPLFMSQTTPDSPTKPFWVQTGATPCATVCNSGEKAENIGVRNHHPNRTQQGGLPACHWYEMPCVRHSQSISGYAPTAGGTPAPPRFPMTESPCPLAFTRSSVTLYAVPADVRQPSCMTAARFSCFLTTWSFHHR